MRCIRDLSKALRELERISNRTTSENQLIAVKTVEEIIDEVRTNGDKALIKFTKKFDGFEPIPLTIEKDELEEAWINTPTEIQAALKVAHARITNFHKQQLPKDLALEGIHGEKLGRRWKPVEKAGIYIPGGRASYPSTVLMNAIPAKVAGVDQLIMTSPAGKDGQINQTVLAAAFISNIKKVIRIGGAQAIGALAYGTESIPKVDVITGPGNLYVTLAKKSVYGKVGIDSLAGPSEILIIADQTAKLTHVAADLLAQAEHDPLAAAILITTNEDLAIKLPKELNRQLEKHPRAEICKESLNNWGLIIICSYLSDCCKLSDQFAPEHLELLTENPSSLTKDINNAGAIFIGPWTPEAVGDYLAGPNHTLPTCGTARFSSALCVETFLKNTSLIEFNEKSLRATSREIELLAKSEGLYSHSESVKIRISES